MKVGIIVYSQTGNTYSVAQKLKDKLLMSGHSVILDRLTIQNEKETDVKNIKLNSIPDISKYDILLIGCPVHGFSMAPAMAAYFTKVSSLKNKKIACFVTQLFPFPWMGGNQTIKQMKKICESKGAVVCGTGIVNWKNKRRENMINDVVENISKLF